MVTFQPEFFPYELLLLVGVIALFFVIHRYLNNSLFTKKEILAESILKDLERKKLNFEGRLAHYFQDPYSKDKLNNIISDVLNNLKKADEATRYFFYDTNREFHKNQDIDNFYLLIDTHRLLQLSQNIRWKELDKFRLRDLERIQKNPSLLEVVYKQRTKGGN